jgi:hypothetical protein
LNDKNDPLDIKGVVYNEMKGVYSSPDALLGRITQQTLFPENVYSNDSGGDPEVLPTLTFEQFQQYHKNYYHPSNAKIYFYGDNDVIERLNFADSYLCDFNKLDHKIDSKITYQKKKDFHNSKSLIECPPVRLQYAISKDTPESVLQNKYMVTVNWVLNDKRLSTKDMLKLSILNHILLGTSSSILHKKLTESNYGESVIVDGINSDLLQSTFSIGLKNINMNNYNNIIELIHNILYNITINKLDKMAIESSLNTIEFSLKEFNTGSFPKGLSLMLSMLKEWIYEYDPIDGVRYENDLNEIKSEISQNIPIFEELINKYILNNSHVQIIVMEPNPLLEETSQEKYINMLKDKKSSMSDNELDNIVMSTQTLKNYQLAEDSKEVKEMLPKLSLQDIKKEITITPRNVINVDNLSTYVSNSSDRDINWRQYVKTLTTHTLPTNGILYANIGFDYSKLDLDDIHLLPLFSRMLFETGTKSMDSVTLSQHIGIKTGGINSGYTSNIITKYGDRINDPNNVILYMLFNGKCLTHKIPDMLTIMNDIIMNANLHDSKRCIEMIRESIAHREESVISNGHRYGLTRIASKYSFLGYLSEHTNGLTYLRQLDNLLHLAENNYEQLHQKFVNIKNKILQSGNGLVINLTGDENVINESLKHLPHFIKNLPVTQSTVSATETLSMVDKWKQTNKHLTDSNNQLRNEGFVVPSQVNYVTRSGPIFHVNDPIKSSYNVVSRFLSNGYLWDNVRVLGGAYGGFCSLNYDSGRFAFGSYRDPNVIATLNIYKNTSKVLSDMLSNNEITNDVILQSIIGKIGDLDTPLSNSQKGSVSFIQYLTNETYENEQLYRDNIINTNVNDFIEFSKILQKLDNYCHTVVFGSKQALEEANQQLSDSDKLKLENAIDESAVISKENK